MTFFRRPCNTLFRAILLSVLCGLSQFAVSASVTRPEQLIDATREFLEREVTDYLQRSQIRARHEIEINRLDPRLRLAACDRPLTVKLESPAQPIGRTTLRVSCEGAAPWSVFVPAQVHLFREVIVARRPLARESVVEQADVALAERDVSVLTQGYLTAFDQVLGNKITRSALPDQVLAPTYISAAEVVRKGDQVVISAKNSTINVRMPGEALSDGALGTQIRVKNQRSGRTIKARVVGPGQVEVDM
ncbi:flagellar basal body P-ring formation protein FlgA [Pseudomonas sp. KSR10]|uniref:Flagella basal body P-ring formation protein FlgA n=1 Tax=Stutzerimonas stutzeri TaxID=316 RepID=A0A0D9ANJ7_STUST|nr:MULTISPECIES: flagellar basal body P-ring formation chaperone FlgA [Pseudomonadaceae]KJH82578.1 flagellar basal body P-ring biosynthesis protein FlgA [Stutzerimonas stutzeri]MCG6542346.1 flagellar basal body P-ring formation protein FlgA [Pseudomonas sp. KSR10]